MSFIDLDYTNNYNIRQLIDGYISYIEEGPVLWSTKRQETVITEAKYIAVSRAV